MGEFQETPNNIQPNIFFGVFTKWHRIIGVFLVRVCCRTKYYPNSDRYDTRLKQHRVSLSSIQFSDCDN